MNAATGVAGIMLGWGGGTDEGTGDVPSTAEVRCPSLPDKKFRFFAKMTGIWSVFSTFKISTHLTGDTDLALVPPSGYAPAVLQLRSRTTIGIPCLRPGRAVADVASRLVSACVQSEVVGAGEGTVTVFTLERLGSGVLP